jgi:hypothetical protein
MKEVWAEVFVNCSEAVRAFRKGLTKITKVKGFRSLKKNRRNPTRAKLDFRSFPKIPDDVIEQTTRLGQQQQQQQQMLQAR